jgi:hypothetical protein
MSFARPSVRAKENTAGRESAEIACNRPFIRSIWQTATTPVPTVNPSSTAQINQILVAGESRFVCTT